MTFHIPSTTIKSKYLKSLQISTVFQDPRNNYSYQIIKRDNNSNLFCAYMTLESHFTISGRSKGRTIKCNHCEAVVTSNNKDRWISHFVNCGRAPAEVRKHFNVKKRPASMVFVDQKRGNTEVESTVSDRVSATSSFRKISSWIDKVSGGESEELDQLFANVFYYTGIPFRFADSESLKMFMKRARPAYELPSSKRIAGGLLNSTHAKFQEILMETLQTEKHVHLVSDGWSSLRRDHYVNFLTVFSKRNL